MTVIRELLSSKKFLAALAAIIVYVAGRFGLDIQPGALDPIWQALLVYVGAQGIADAGKSAAQVRAAAAPAKDPPAIAVAPVVMPMVVAVIAAVVMATTGCATGKALPGAATTAVIDCTKADAGAIGAVVASLAAQAVVSALGAGAIDWSAIESAAWAQGKAVGGCALAETVAALGREPAPASDKQTLLPPPDPAAEGRAALERFRVRAGGVQWTTSYGVL